MEDIDRRSFLKKSAIGAAAGAVGIGVITGGAGQAAAKMGSPAKTAKTASAAESASDAGSHNERVVAYVRPGSRSEVTLLVGEREIVTRDAELARRLRRAAK